MTRFALLLTVLVACSKDNPYYCEGAACALPDAGSGSQACTSAADCDGATPACNDDTGACVACTADDLGACGNYVCSATNECAACVQHAECATSNACLPHGECGTDANVAYVASGGSDAGPCTKAEPCATLSHAATLGKPFVKLETDITENVTLASSVTVLAVPGTKIMRQSGNDTAVVTISGTSSVVLHDVTITGGSSATGHGIHVAGGANVDLTLDGVTVMSNAGLGVSFAGEWLTMRRSVVTNNSAGGASINADFDITNSLFVKNGGNTSTVGGLLLAGATGTPVFQFNTVADNTTTSASYSNSVICTGAFVLGNVLVKGAAPAICTFEYSMFEIATTAPTGTGNKLGMARFKDTTVLPMTADFYRVASDSDAVDAAAPTSALMEDIDGDERPQNGVRDIGADEYK